MVVLNEKTEESVKKIHLMITNKCNRDCKDCCNKQYDVYKDVPIITNEELSKAETIYLTGGEPFLYGQPNEIAEFIKRVYQNVKSVVVYTNAMELEQYLRLGASDLLYIDGMTISIKNMLDEDAFLRALQFDYDIIGLPLPTWIYKCNTYTSRYTDEEWLSNRIGLYYKEKFIVKLREWQKDFKPYPNSIFRRIAVFPEDIDVQITGIFR